MAYNFTNESYIIEGVSSVSGNDTIYEFTADFSPITEILLVMMFIQLVILLLIIRRK